MKPRKPTPIELLAPARNLTVARQAILHGADAVYMGAEHHGARASAGNSIDDIRRTAEFAHLFGARLYVTVNTLVYEHELKAVEQMVRELYRAGVDALIVQDMALLRIDIPPIALHASTQCDIRTPERARFLADVGFSQLVVARESTLDEIAAIARAVPGTSIEAFCHGALCVSYSGDCQASAVCTGRSANRGECAQLCRLPYNLTDKDGRVIIRDRHLLSLRDLNRSANIQAMMDAGVSSFKIEGRLKDEGYVKNVVGAYRRILDNAIAADPERYCRASAGSSVLTFEPDLARSFNRGYTGYFLTSAPKEPMGSHLSPKSTGTSVGVTTAAAKGKSVTAKLTTQLANGDGLGFFGPDGKFTGFRVNRVDGNRILSATEVAIPAGTTLWRNRDKRWDDMLNADTATRTIAVTITLRRCGDNRVALDVDDETGVRVTTTAELTLSPAKTPQTEARRRVLTKTGGTIYTVAGVDDLLGDCFIPASQLTALRREALDLLTQTRLATHHYELRRHENHDAEAPKKINRHYNVANSVAEAFYRSHGSDSVDPAIETAPERYASAPRTVMTTRYCLRRELGACLKTPSAAKLPRDLQLRAPGIVWDLEFDCANCRMKVVAPPSKTKSNTI